MVHRFKYIFKYIFLAVMLGGLVSQMVWADEPTAPKSLWHTVLTPPPSGQPPIPRKPWMLRDREIALDLPLLQILKNAGARPLPKITVELFDNTNPELDVTSTVSRINDTAFIRGTFKPPAQGDFTFVITGNLLRDLSALLNMPGGAYLVGVRHKLHDEPDPRWILRDDVQRGLAAVQDAGIVFDLLIRPRELRASLETVS